jgi:hypothetical protein
MEERGQQSLLKDPLLWAPKVYSPILLPDSPAVQIHTDTLANSILKIEQHLVMWDSPSQKWLPRVGGKVKARPEPKGTFYDTFNGSPTHGGPFLYTFHTCQGLGRYYQTFWAVIGDQGA